MAVDKEGNIRAVPKPEKGKKKGGVSPRRAGDRVERIVADELGEKRTVGSGAFKNTNKNLTGDVEVRDAQGKDYVKLEIKMTGQINTKGERSYTLTMPVLEQMEREAHDAHELGALVIYFKGGKKYVLMPFDDWHVLLEDAKRGRL